MIGIVCAFFHTEGKGFYSKVNTNFDVELAEQYEVQSNPTLILFKDGQAKDRKVGALKQADLNSWIEEQI